ncbi:Hypothetical protein PBC10988_3480 [Planctomycetales bacterium 10988]|nr:Hypothetical protein PBC10988_3480 [Planctomycetales bacterium 10988]
MKKQLTPGEVDTFIRQLKYLFAGIVFLFIIPLTIYGLYLNQRMETFESSLHYRPPQETDVTEMVPFKDHYHLDARPSTGQEVYVPAYSHVYHGNGEPHLLTITLSVRNTSTKDNIFIKSVRYYDTKGKEVKSYFQKQVRLSPLETTEVLVDREDATGGSGANFLVEWFAERPVTEPIIEAVMIDTKSQQGISFVRRGSVISEIASASEESNSSVENSTEAETE